VTGFDPPEDFWAGSELERIVAGCETATDGFIRAVDAHSAAEAAYLRAYHSAWARLVDVSKSKADADRTAEHAAVEERVREKHAAGAMESAKALLRTRLAVLSAAQSHLRAVERRV
jgi:hypothetical protein